MEATCVHQRRNGQRRCGICVHTQTRTVEYYSAVKKSDILPFAAMWMDLEMIILSEVSQIEKDKYYMISLLCGASQVALVVKNLSAGDIRDRGSVPELG